MEQNDDELTLFQEEATQDVWNKCRYALVGLIGKLIDGLNPCYVSNNILTQQFLGHMTSLFQLNTTMAYIESGFEYIVLDLLKIGLGMDQSV